MGVVAKQILKYCKDDIKVGHVNYLTVQSAYMFTCLSCVQCVMSSLSGSPTIQKRSEKQAFTVWK